MKKDQDFILTNKVTFIINCAATEIPNHFQDKGVKYFSLLWKEDN